MLFNSIQFLFFFPVVTILYFVLPHKYRWFLLLSASCAFYMAFIPAYILILFLTIIVDYVAGILIERSIGKKRTLFFVISIISTVSILFVFKYFNFFIDNVNSIATFLHWNYSIDALKIILPIGLSFHTFQSMSYVIEVYRGKFKAEYNLGIYALYVMFYPQLVAGPIERPHNLLHQFYEKHVFRYERVASGLRLMLWGLFKKMVIADRLALIVNEVYNNAYNYHGAALIIATLFFAIQIYCDFSGYSDIAIGAARVMGFKLMKNFDQPYYSKSISEFWRRWHISLSSWFKDYVYKPLGGSRVPVPRWYLNLLIVFLISGLWHGANWTFLVWGAINGFYMIFSNMTKQLRGRLSSVIGLWRWPRFHSALNIVFIFALTNIAWVFFRADSLADALYIVSNFFVGGSNFGDLKNIFGLDYLIIVSAAIILMEMVHFMQRHNQIKAFFTTKPAWIRWGVYFMLIVWILLFGLFENVQFIYFQF